MFTQPQQTKSEACVVIRDVEGVERKIPVQTLLRHPVVMAERTNSYESGYSDGQTDSDWQQP